jgi:thioredoxin 1
MALEITDANFDELVLKSDKPVIVDFWAEWCGPCRMIGPVIDEMSKEYEGKAVIGKVNVDLNSNVSAQFNVRSIPTVLFIKNGEVVDKSVGAVPKASLVSKLEALLSESSKEKDEMRAMILNLTKEVAALTVKVEFLTKENDKLEKALPKAKRQING